jgi:hypothetical protein
MGDPQPLESPSAVPESWDDFLASFSAQHRGWLSTLEIEQNGRVRRLVEEAPLEAVRAARLDGALTVLVRDGTRSRSHLVSRPLFLCFDTTREGRHRGLTIGTRDGAFVRIRFRVAAHPEQVGDVPR